MLDPIVRQAIETTTRWLKKQTGEGYEFITIIMPYHLTQIKHLSSEQRTIMERKVAQAAQAEFKRLIKEEGS